MTKSIDLIDSHLPRASVIQLILGEDETNLIRQLASRIETSLVNLPDSQIETSELHGLALQIYQSRRQRVHFFDTKLFSEPAWDMLLAAYCFGTSSNDLTVSGLCYASDCPPTTALRWISSLVDHGLLRRYPCPKDRRKVLIGLTPQAHNQIENYLRRIGARLHCSQVTGKTD